MRPRPSNPPASITRVAGSGDLKGSPSDRCRDHRRPRPSPPGPPARKSPKIRWAAVVGWTLSQNRYSSGLAQTVPGRSTAPLKQGVLTLVRPYWAGLLDDGVEQAADIQRDQVDREGRFQTRQDAGQRRVEGGGQGGGAVASFPDRPRSNSGVRARSLRFGTMMYSAPARARLVTACRMFSVAAAARVSGASVEVNSFRTSLPPP